MHTAIGIDIGGTKISIVLGTPAGRILARTVIPTRLRAQASNGIHELIQSVEDVIRRSRIRRENILGIGIASPGAVNTQKAVIPVSPNLPGWQGRPLGRILSRRFSVPVTMANDANAAAVAEKIFGQAKKADNFIYITVSTGIGGGIVVHSKLLEGASYVTGEIGHMILVPGGNPCNCGSRGCLEAYASGTAIARYVDAGIRKGRKASIRKRDLKLFGAKAVGLAAKEKDALALEAYRQAGYYLGIGLANLLNILNPELIIFGGGVWRSAPPLFRETLMNSCRANAWPQAFRGVRIVRSKLGGSVGDLGALALVFEKSKKPEVRSKR